VLAVYVSGHGFGHATRTGEVLREVRERAPDLPIAVCTSAPRALFSDAVAPPLSVREIEVDVGLVQKDALTIDEVETAAAVGRFLSGWPALVEREAHWLRGAGAALVLGDIPPLAFAAAAEAGVPSVALGNFSWDWIYRHLGRRHPLLLQAADHAASAYSKAGLLLRLPFAGDLSAFPRIEDIPLVARRPAVPKAEARRRLSLDGRPAVLLSFGGIGMPELDPLALGRLGDYVFLLTGRVGGADAPNVRRLEARDLAAGGLGYTDLVGAVDVVVSKPGYGIVTDCIGAGTRFVYTDRGDFPEYPILVAGMSRYLPVCYVSNDDLRAGRLEAALREVRAIPAPPPLATDGAEVAARRLLALALRQS
jgi:L-arabinokinase